MDQLFSDADVMLIEKEIRSKSYKDIAFLLDRTVDELKAFLETWLPGKDITPKEQQLQARRPVRVPVAREPRVSKEPKRPAGRPKKEKEPLIISRRIEQEQKVKRDRQGKPIFKTKEIDLSKLKEVRIDRKTCIYIKPGQDPEKAKRDYLKRLKEYKSRMMASETI